jgi:hypothetical protein
LITVTLQAPICGSRTAIGRLALVLPCLSTLGISAPANEIPTGCTGTGVFGAGWGRK